MVICLGPVCIPVWTLLPFLWALLTQFKDRIVAWWKGSSPPQAKSLDTASGSCCSSSCSSEPANSETSNKFAGQIVTLENEEQFQSLIETKGRTVFVDFTATWCVPCKKIAPKFEELCKEYKESIFVKIDVDEWETVASNCKVAAMPTFQAYREGGLLESFSGANEEKLVSFVTRNA